MEYALAVLIGYLFGCSNMAYYLSKFKKIDLGKAGSGNLGTSNTVTEVGLKAGLLVFFHDVFKAVIAILLAQLLFADVEFIGHVAGFACILGHIFPFYNKFKGGKGFATYVGVVYTLEPILALILTPIVIAIILFTDYIISGSFAVAIAFSIFLFAFGQWQAGILSVIVLIVMIFKHLGNFKRILNGTEKSVLEGLIKKKPKTDTTSGSSSQSLPTEPIENEDETAENSDTGVSN